MTQPLEVMAALSQGVLVESVDGHVLWVNQAWCDLLGVAVPPSQWTGARVGALLGCSTELDDLARFVSSSTDASASPSEEHQRKDGTVLRRRVMSSDRGRVTLVEPPPAPVDEPRVLVVDDNAVNRTLLEGMLAVLGAACDTVDDGQQALDALEQRTYSVVVMDVAMPVLDGHAATRRLRERETGRRTPVIALTAAGTDDDRRRSIEAGMDAFLVKPVSLATLRAALAPYLSHPQDGPRAEGEVLDAARLASLEEQLGDPDLVRLAVATYLEELPGRVRTMVESLASDDRDGLRRASHTLKSSSAMLGATAVSRLCADVELQALTGSAADLTRLVSSVQDSEGSTARALSQWAHAS